MTLKWEGMKIEMQDPLKQKQIPQAFGWDSKGLHTKDKLETDKPLQRLQHSFKYFHTGLN